MIDTAVMADMTEMIRILPIWPRWNNRLLLLRLKNSEIYHRWNRTKNNKIPNLGLKYLKNSIATRKDQIHRDLFEKHSFS